MEKALILETRETPSYWNKELLIGLLGAGPVGAVVGAIIGKRRMEREEIAGRVVREQPPFWNKDTLLGALIGNIAAGIAGNLIIAKAAVIATATGTLPVGMLVAAAGVMLGAITLGIYAGAKVGQRRIEHEYKQAEAQRLEREGVDIEHTRMPEISPDIEREKSFAQEILEERKALAERKLRAPAELTQPFSS